MTLLGDPHLRECAVPRSASLSSSGLGTGCPSLPEPLQGCVLEKWRHELELEQQEGAARTPAAQAGRARTPVVLPCGRDEGTALFCLALILVAVAVVECKSQD